MESLRTRSRYKVDASLVDALPRMQIGCQLGLLIISLVEESRKVKRVKKPIKVQLLRNNTTELDWATKRVEKQAWAACDGALSLLSALQVDRLISALSEALILATHHHRTQIRQRRRKGKREDPILRKQRKNGYLFSPHTYRIRARPRLCPRAIAVLRDTQNVSAPLSLPKPRFCPSKCYSSARWLHHFCRRHASIHSIISFLLIPMQIM